MDNTTIHPLCASQAHIVDLRLRRGAPENLDETRPIRILVNHGYVVGFCPDRLQPAWSAYRVAYATDDVDYDGPLNSARFVAPLREHLGAAGLGHVSEIADAEPPFTPRGCPFQTWSLGELIRLEHDVLA